ncbi:MAG: dethiobiotin synthase [Proteobacteria bacterium]|nr:dethiobiotin synthase [Pseudomonadota bacterium]MBU1714001.1 dethiobiotin synthase [Pseudomonadota bacterium]
MAEINSIFITATDTSVGKTFIAGLLLNFMRQQGLEAGYQKWVSTGDAGQAADLKHCLDFAGLSLTADLSLLQVPYKFEFPASPHLAAELEAKQVEPEFLVSCYKELLERYEFLIVEGVGGLLVPLRRDLLLADLLRRFKMPAILVARSGLGTLNHTLLILEAMRHRELELLGVILSDSGPAEDETLVRDNMRTIAEIGQVKVLGRMIWSQSKEEAVNNFRPLGQEILNLIEESKSGNKGIDIPA